MMLPHTLQRVEVPPIKIQGIKTDLVPLIASSVRWHGRGRWIEPFAGSCVVALNIRPNRAVITDSNPHLIRFMRAIASGELTPSIVREYLVENGRLLLERGEDHYYDIRERFNEHGNPLDFLFINRACFNGLMRFNKKGGFNVPFCRKPERFRQAYVTKVVNQVAWVRDTLRHADWSFICQDWRKTLSLCEVDDFVYLDPPYVGRHTDYYNQWSDGEAESLATIAKALPCGFAASMWLENEFRKNAHVDRDWIGVSRVTTSHFYHVGASEDLRHPIIEVLLIPPGSLADGTADQSGDGNPACLSEKPLGAKRMAPGVIQGSDPVAVPAPTRRPRERPHKGSSEPPPSILQERLPFG
jgi:DNA adenine methylase